MARLSRREFLQWTTGGLAAAALSDWIFFKKALEAQSQETPTLFYHACHICDCNCGMIYQLKNGRIVEMRGNPADKLGAAGKLCVKGYSTPRLYHDPCRLSHPLQRTNPRKGRDEDPAWKIITWDEAFARVGEQFRRVYDQHGPDAILLFARPKPWDSHLQNAVGTPNQLCHVDTCYINHEIAGKAVSGNRIWGWNFSHAKYIVGFGYDQVGKSKNIHQREFMEARRNGAKIVIFDPRLSETAQKADLWIPIRPGTDLAALLAMIHVILNERCIGCGACVDACPYGARYMRQVGQMVKADKCTWCYARVYQGQKPVCVEKCITGALLFGLSSDPAIKAALEEPGVDVYHPEYNTKPQLYRKGVRPRSKDVKVLAQVPYPVG